MTIDAATAAFVAAVVGALRAGLVPLLLHFVAAGVGATSVSTLDRALYLVRPNT